jgi:serine/threonine-protein kinase
MAPELLTDPGLVDGRTDLYALGAVAYFLLTGEPVFSGGVVEVFGHHLHTQPKPPGALSDPIDSQLEAIVLRCLEKDPDDRFQSAAALAEALRACAIAKAWTRPRARAWWDERRGEIEARRTSAQEPVNLTVARA